MRFNAKNYKAQKTKNYIKTKDIFFLLSGVNRNSNDWISTKQKLKKIHFDYYKVFNKIAIKTLEESIYKKTITTINGATFFMTPTKISLSKNVLLNKFEPLLFTILSVKLNNKFYSIKQLKNVHSLNYKKNKLLLYQFMVTNLKFYYNPNLNKSK